MNKVQHLPMSQLVSMVKDKLTKFNAEGLIDENDYIKTVMYCNAKLGLYIRDIREAAIPVNENRATLPLDFDKLFYTCALKATNTMVHELRNPYDNSFDSDVIYEACLDRESLGCVDNYNVIIKRDSKNIVYKQNEWIELGLDSKSFDYCHIDCPNKHKKGKYTISIKDDYIETPFRAGTLYMLYLGLMKDEEGNITFPFHELLTPYYEWSIIEEVLSNALFNSDATNIGELYQLAKKERGLAWLDAYNFASSTSYRDAQQSQRKKELSWYSKYFRYFQ